MSSLPPVSIFEMSFKTLWPVIIVAGAGLIAWGATTARVAANERALTEDQRVIESMQSRRREDRDTLVTVKTKVEGLDGRTKTIEADVKEILNELRRIAS